MKQLLPRKSFALAMGILSVVLIILLAGSMDFLALREGTPFSYLEAQEEQSAILLEAPDMTWIFVIVIAILLGLIAVAIYFATPKQRRRLIIALLLWAVAFAAIMWWISRDAQESAVTPTPLATLMQTPIPAETLPLAVTDAPEMVYEQPALSPWLSIGVTFLALFVAVLIVWLTLRHRLRDQVPLDALADIAAQAVDELQAGMDYGDAIINCYASMIAVLDRQRGIRRRGNLTPAEFIAVLERARLPSASVRRLTALFERVRYGGKKPLQAEIDEAVACLNEIIAAIREVRG